MPVQACTAKGKSGKKYGKKGKCYTGKNATSLAKRQGRAIEANRKR